MFVLREPTERNGMLFSHTHARKHAHALLKLTYHPDPDGGQFSVGHDKHD